MVIHIKYKDGNSETCTKIEKFQYSNGTLVVVEEYSEFEIELTDVESFSIVK